MPIARSCRTLLPALLVGVALLLALFASTAPVPADAASRPAAKSALAKAKSARAKAKLLQARTRVACRKARRRYGRRSVRARRACTRARIALRKKARPARGRAPAPTEPAPTEPAPTEPAPTEPVAEEPVPVSEPAPAPEPAPEPEPVSEPAADPVPETEPLPEVLPVPPTSRLHWNGDFSTGSWSQWDSADDDCRPQDHSVVTSPKPPGFAYASRHTVTVDSTLGQSGTRCLVYNDPKSDPTRGKSHAYAGAEAWYEDWMYFPADFDPAPSTDWNWVWQLHNWPDSEGPVNLVAGVITNSSDGGPSGGERLSLRVIGGASEANPIDSYGTGNYRNNPDVKEKWLRGPNIQRGHWYRMVVHVKWSRHATGLTEYWLDDQLVGAHVGPNLFYHASGGGYANPDHAGQAYYSVGYYRSRASLPAETVYHAGTKVHKP